MTTQAPVISSHHVSKKYGQHLALNNVNFDVLPGRIVGLLGPNGAGKTTLLKGILGLAKLEGELTVLGANPTRNRNAFLADVSFIADTALLPRWLRVSQVLEYMVGVHPRFNLEKAQNFLSKTTVKMTSKIAHLSKGMITQLHLALVIAIDSKLLVLDEPTLGLDIIYRKEFYNLLLNDYFDHEKTILITTHQVEEVQHILTDLIFISNGKIILNTAIDELDQRFCQLEVNNEQYENLLGARLTPLHQQQKLGGYTLIFDGESAEKLNAFGRTLIPSIADLFVATVNPTKEAL